MGYEMIRIIRDIISQIFAFWCVHQWTIIESGPIEHVGSGHGLATGAVVGKWVRYRCDHCGATKTKRWID